MNATQLGQIVEASVRRLECLAQRPADIASELDGIAVALTSPLKAAAREKLLDQAAKLRAEQALLPQTEGAFKTRIAAERKAAQAAKPDGRKPAIAKFEETTAAPTIPGSMPDPLAIQFTDQSDPGNASSIGWEWRFGDGLVSYEQNTVHSYAEPGPYAVSLTVTTPFGADTTTEEITVGKAGNTARKTK